MGKKALITGIGGQDGSFLAEFLLSKGYQVFGIKRRVSISNTIRINHILDDIELIEGDMLDFGSLAKAVSHSQPDEVYNLAAQSFVKTSFDQPELTGEITGLGVTRILEAVRQNAPKARFYQASTSEMWGGSPPPQHEKTPFYPRSPYGTAKLYGHWMTVNYREQGMFACSGILCNHECITADTPIIIKRNGLIDIVPIGDVVPHRTSPHSGTKYTTVPDETFEVWDKDKWVKVTCMTATWNNKDDKKVLSIAARGSVFSATSSHVCFAKGSKEIQAGDISLGDMLELGSQPEPVSAIRMTETEAWFLGMLAGDGHVNEKGGVRVTNLDDDILKASERAWFALTGQTVTQWSGQSGYSENFVSSINCNGSHRYGEMLRSELYTRERFKRVPFRILNADRNIQLAFLRGYNEADGLKAGYSKYEFKSFKTDSAALAAGLYWLSQVALGQRAIICVEYRGEKPYYQINLNAPDKPGAKGDHLKRPLEEVVKVQPLEYEGWLFDIATESGTFHAGIGLGWIHNSPRRGPEFVTQKIAQSVASIKLGYSDKLKLGNLEARRDWGHAKDFVEAMWLMLQHDKPDDYVIATGKAHSVRNFAEAAFSHVGLNYTEYVEVDQIFSRPTEVEYLLGDASKAKNILGWQPKIAFEELVTEMVDWALAHPEEWLNRAKNGVAK